MPPAMLRLFIRFANGISTEKARAIANRPYEKENARHKRNRFDRIRRGDLRSPAGGIYAASTN